MKPLNQKIKPGLHCSDRTSHQRITTQSVIQNEAEVIGPVIEIPVKFHVNQPGGTIFDLTPL